MRNNLSGNQFKQLSMVHQNQYGEESAHSYVPVRDVAERWEHSEGPMSRKLAESKEGSPSLYQQIAAAGGVDTPVLADSLWHDTDAPMDRHLLRDGHHRAAALYDQAPDADIPVLWNGGMDPARRG